MALITLPKQDWPRDLGWLVVGENCTQLQYDVCARAMRDIGILEVPNGSNRGTRLDRMTIRAGLKPPQWWCAIWAGEVLADAGSLIPRDFPGTDYWLPHIEDEPCVGAAILYGLRKPGPVLKTMNAHHIGIVVRLPEPKLGQQLMLTVEGNRAFSGTASNNGVAVDIGPVLRKDILGYYHPKAA